MNPIKIFWFYVSVGLMSIAFAITYELYLENVLPFKFAKFSTLFEIPEKPEEKLIKELKKFVDADTLSVKEASEDTARLRQILDSILAEEKKIIFPDDNHEHLWKIFRKAEKGKRIRILHYGDSQIEGERITAQIRNELQKLFGGRGPGLVPVIPVAPKLSVKTQYSDHWRRVPGFGKVDTTIKHGRFGPLIVYFESSPDSSQPESWFVMQPNKYAYYRAKRYDKVVFFWSIPEDTARVKIFVNDSLYHDSVYEQARLIIKEFEIPTGAKITLKHSGSPIHVYAVSLENKASRGVVMDNIPLRGSAGTIFTRQNKSFIKLFYDYLKPDLIILQFGGNVVPYIDNEKRCKNYGRWFASQIRYLKSIAPETSILVIGPADMATVVDGKLQTYPILECVINVLKEAALKNDAMFWNMYLNMGGSGTIIKWAEADTPLAAKDYVHFTIPGVKKVAKMLWEDILYEYNLYKQAKEGKTEGL